VGRLSGGGTATTKARALIAFREEVISRTGLSNDGVPVLRLRDRLGPPRWLNLEAADVTEIAPIFVSRGLGP
jgi:hypothetical protein